MTIAILGLVAALVPLLTWYVKRRKQPSREERIDDAQSDYDRSIEEVFAARAAGDHARAESLLRRLYDRANAASHSEPRANGQRDPRDPASGNDSANPKQG